MGSRVLRTINGAALAALLAGAPVAPAAAAAPLAVAGQQAPTASVVRNMSAAEAQRRLKRKAKITFLDTRPDIGDETIAGAVNASADVLEVWARNVPKNTTIVAFCTCEDDGLAIEAVTALQRMGFTNAYVLPGGLDAARAAGIPMGRPSM